MTTLINHWMKHPELKRTEELLLHLYRMRMATSQNIADVMGLSMRTVRESLISQIYRQNKNLILSHSLKNKKKAYYLGQEGCRIVSQILGTKISFYDYTGSQARHFEGINSILARLVKKMGVDTFRTQTEWYFTRQARDLIQKEWATLLHAEVQAGHITEEQAIEKINALPEPDARFLHDQQAYWLEFDNDTEAPKKLLAKMMDYIETLVAMDNRDPVIWVVTERSPRRKNALQQLWEQTKTSSEVQRLQEGYGTDFFFPSMHFFLEGEETDLLLPRSVTT